MDDPFLFWFFYEADNILFRANPTDELQERILKTPIIDSIFLRPSYLDEWYPVGVFTKFLSDLKKSVCPFYKLQR